MPINEDVIKLFESSDMNNEVDEIEFDPIPVGERSTKTIFMKNTIDEEIFIDEISVDSVNNQINVDSFEDKINPNSIAQIRLSAKPNSNNLKGLKGRLNIEAQFIVVPD